MFGVLVQYPGSGGEVRDIGAVVEEARERAADEAVQELMALYPTQGAGQ